MAFEQCILMFLLLSANEEACTGVEGWLFYSLLSNPGLNSSTIPSEDACISSCESSGACSAISYNRPTQTCVYSYCANLFVVKNTGWHTYVLYSLPVENYDYPAPQFEWMLTDACGLANTGNLSGVPAMTLAAGASYLPSPSAYLGDAVYLSSSVSTSNPTIYTTTSSLLNCSFALTGFSFGGWFNFDDSPSGMEFFSMYYLNSPNNFQYGLELSLFYGLHITMPGAEKTSSYNAPADVWTHYAMVYNPSTATVNVYVNMSLAVSFQVNKMTSIPPCNMVTIGTRPGPWGQFTGRTFCSRLYYSTLKVSQLKLMAQACLKGRVRFASVWKFR